MNIHYRIHKKVANKPLSLDPTKECGMMRYEDIQEITEKCFSNEELIIHPFKFYMQYSQNQIRLMMERQDIYMLPTEELCDFLDKVIADRSAIEIGAGKGYLGRELGITVTDSFAKRDSYPMKIDKMMGIPTIVYPDYVENLDAIQSVKKYKPHTVIASYLVHEQIYKDRSKTFGVDGKKLLNMCKRYIHIGNLDLHCSDPIMNIPHTEIEFPYLITKNMNPYTDRIFIWGNDGLNDFEKNNGLKHYKLSYEIVGDKKYSTEFVAPEASTNLSEYGNYWMNLDIKKQFTGRNVNVQNESFTIEELP